MRFGVLGTGMVGKAIASRLVEVGHEVCMGSRTADNKESTSWATGAGDRASRGALDSNEFNLGVVRPPASA